MDPNRTDLPAQNNMTDAYVVSYPFIARAPPSRSRPVAQTEDETMKRRDSFDSLDSIAREKEEAHIPQPERSGLRLAFSRVARRLSGAGKEKDVEAAKRDDSVVSKSAPMDVYVLGSQAVYFPRSNRR